MDQNNYSRHQQPYSMRDRQLDIMRSQKSMLAHKRFQKNRLGLKIPILVKNEEQEAEMMNEAHFVKNKHLFNL